MSSHTSTISGTAIDPTWWVFILRPVLNANTVFDGYSLFFFIVVLVTTSLLKWTLFPGGVAWKNNRTRLGRVPIPGPRGLPIFGSLFVLSHNLPHRALAAMVRDFKARDLMAFSIGNTPAVVSSDPVVAREILFHGGFADRPLKQSARELMFGRAIGFAPSGSYWRLLRRLAATHLFAPRRIANHESSRQADCEVMLKSISEEQGTKGFVSLRRHLQGAALNNIMGMVFGKSYDVSMENDEDLLELKYLVREGFELLGAFNWSDHLPWLSFFFDHNHVSSRCAALVPRVRRFVKSIIKQHKEKRDRQDFVDVLLSVEGDDKLEEDDMIAVLWEMIFRGTDTTALLTEWAMAELVLNRNVQTKLRHELNQVTGSTADADVARLPYLQAVIKETLRVHPPGPLLSWARMSTSDVHLSNGMVVPANTTAMVNMWSISNDLLVWSETDKFKPERFVVNEGGVDIDVKGSDTRLAPFGAGRRVCPGKNLGLVTVGLWLARLVKEFEWKEVDGSEVDLTEVLKLSCEMKTPLMAVAVKV